MKRRELAALAVVLIVVVAIPLALFGYQAARQRSAPGGIRVVEVVARIPENGGFSPDRLEMAAGETVRLRLSSPDVVHGLEIPGLGVTVEEITPGKVVEVDVTAREAGRYAFQCIRWCSVDHWRMRGYVEVAPGAGAGASAAAAPTSAPPLYQQLGIDLDRMVPTPAVLPSGKPSAAAGGQVAGAAGVSLPGQLADPAARRAISPAAAFDLVRNDPANQDLSDDDVWNLIAWAWLKDTPPETLAWAEERYSRDCAACHGTGGKGDGVAGRNLPGLAKMDPMMPAGPADFTDGSHRLAESDAFLQGKLLRGGMGTGMPEFGSLYTGDELWAMVAKLRRFIFDP